MMGWIADADTKELYELDPSLYGCTFHLFKYLGLTAGKPRLYLTNMLYRLFHGGPLDYTALIRETAREFGCTPGAVTTALRRAKQKARARAGTLYRGIMEGRPDTDARAFFFGLAAFLSEYELVVRPGLGGCIRHILPL